MSSMHKALFDILQHLNEGIIVLNDKLEILIWNNYMENITDLKQDQVIKQNIYKVFPKLDTNYIRESVNSVIKRGYRAFLSAAMHKKLIAEHLEVNLTISKYDYEGVKYLIIECIDVTSQFTRIKQLKDSVNQLHSLNKKLQEKEKIIKKLAYYDPLTGLANRTLFYEISEKYLATAKRNKSILGLMFIDVDNFKNINDMYGHKTGDKVLLEVANILKKCTRRSDVIARYGGDEFLVLLSNINSYHNYKFIVSKIRYELYQRISK